MTSRTRAANAANILSLVGSGRATTRTMLVRALGCAPSTVSLRVAELIDAGLIDEARAAGSERGRPTRRLSLRCDGSFVVAIDLSCRRTRIAIVNVADEIEARTQAPVDLGDGPTAVLTGVLERAKALMAADCPDRTLRAVAVSVPGPVDPTTGTMTLPSRMPGWAGFGVGGWLQARMAVPVVVENDANVMAYGEHMARRGGEEATVYVKAGEGIGAGVIIGGRIYHGAAYTAGDITHVRVPQAGDLPCSCGNHGCLETVASGAGLVETLRRRGVQVATTAEIVDLAQAGDPAATTAVRAAGAMLGQMLCAVTNFLNPRAIYLGGALPAVEPYIAAVRSQIYEGSHPLATNSLTIERARLGRDGELTSLAYLALEASLKGTR